MSNKMLISVEKIIISDNGEYIKTKPINCVMAMTWKAPNFETSTLVASPFVLDEIKPNNEFIFKHLSPRKKMAFKAIADGPSLLEVELLVAKNATSIDKIVSALLETSVGVMSGGSGALPWVGATLGAIFGSAEIDKDKILRFAVGELEIDESTNNSQEIFLKCPGDIEVHSRNLDPSTFEPIIDRVIRKDDIVGTLAIRLDTIH
jgi:hypothetical protein